MRKLLLLALLPLFSVTLAQPPAGYYNPASDLNGVALQTALHSIIDNHSVQSYASLWTAFQTTDKQADGKVWDMYANCSFTFVTNQCGNYGSECDCYNREHSWPKSWFGDQAPMNTDLYHLYPTDGYVNGRRSNYPFGTVSTATWTSGNGSKVGACNYPGYTGTVFEPVDEYKGDFARTYFYMSTRYYNEDSGWPGSDMTTGAQLKPWALAMLKEWHQSDPVSEKETDRNNAVYQIQDNRNPFIDHPEYVAQIWGGTTSVNGIIYNTDISVYPVPATDYCIIDHNGVYNQQTLSVSIRDIAGRTYEADYTCSNGVIRLNTLPLAHGFYLILVSENGKVPAYARIVK